MDAARFADVLLAKTQPPFWSGLVTFEEPHPSAWAGSKDSPLFQLAARMRVAKQTLHAAMTELAQAEHRLSEVQTEGSQRRRRPSWYVAAGAQEEAAGEALELIYQKIVQTPAHTKAGLAIKLQLVFARDPHGAIPLMILDWDIVQIQGALLETWLPSVFQRLEELMRLCRARRGSPGALIEDKDSGTILLQQALNRGMPAHAIESKLTAMGKDERAFSVSGYVHQGKVKYTEHAFNKTVV